MRTQKSTLFLLLALAGWTLAAKADYLQTTHSGVLTIEWISADIGLPNLEFGLGTPDTNSTVDERYVALYLTQPTGHGPITVTPSTYIGELLPAGSIIDFYLYARFNSTDYWAFSSSLSTTPTQSDLGAFTDTDNSLGLGGIAAELIGTDSWLLHLDDPLSFNVDDDDNDFVVHAYIDPSPVPIPASGLLLGGAAFLLVSKMRRSMRFIYVKNRG